MANYPQLDDLVGVWKLKDVNDAVMGGYWRSANSVGLFGGVVAGANKSQKKKLFNFGKNLGTAFQLTDDALDYEGSSSKMGKNNGDDFYEGKVTLPVILALKTADRKEKDFWKKTFNKKVRNKTDLRIAKKIIKDKDTINQTLALANKYGEKAKNIMKDFESNPVRNALIDLVDFSLIRNY